MKQHTSERSTLTLVHFLRHPQLNYSVLPCVVFKRKKGKTKTLEFDSLEFNLRQIYTLINFTAN